MRTLVTGRSAALREGLFAELKDSMADCNVSGLPLAGLGFWTDASTHLRRVASICLNDDAGSALLR